MLVCLNFAEHARRSVYPGTPPSCLDIRAGYLGSYTLVAMNGVPIYKEVT